MPALFPRSGTAPLPLLLLCCAAMLSACGAPTSDNAAPAEPAPLKPIAAPQVSRWSQSLTLPIAPSAAANLPNGQVRLWASTPQGRRIDVDPARFTTVEREAGAERGESCAGARPATRTLVGCHDVAVPLQDGSWLAFGGPTGSITAHIVTEGVGSKPVVSKPLPGLARGLREAASGSGDGAPWFFAAPNGQVLQGGLGPSLHWIDPRAGGKLALAGPREGDAGLAGGLAVMFDSGRILAIGGAPTRDDGEPGRAQIIDVNAGLSVHTLAPAPIAGRVRKAIALPNGEVLVIGTAGAAALWSPKSERFTTLPGFEGIGDGHLTTVLLPDARVLTAQQPDCRVDCNNLAAELRILTPHYLLNADGTPAARPVITSAPARAAHGTRIDVQAGSAVDQFVLVRSPAASPAADREQRRISLPFSRVDDSDYSLSLPANPGLMVPGDYLLFALNAAGVPSVATAIHVGAEAAPALLNPGPQVNPAHAPLMLTTRAATPEGSLSFAANGLPPGLEIDPATGTISGTPSQEGEYAVELSASNGTATTSTMLAWSIDDAAARASWVRLETRTASNDELPVAIDAFDLLGRDGAPINRDGRKLSNAGAGAKVVRASMSSRSSVSHFEAEPRGLTIALGARQAIAGFRLSRHASSVALATWRFFTSDDGSRWTLASAGHFKQAGNLAVDQTVMLNRAPSLAPVAAVTTRLGEPALLAVTASDADGDPLHFSADGLPRGLAINAETGLISGTPADIGAAQVTVHVSDGNNPPVDGSFEWQVSASSMVIEPVLATPQAAGSSVGFMVRANRSAVRYRWRFGDGSPELAAGAATMASHVYAAPGLYTVTVSATDSSGQRERLSFTQAIYASTGPSRWQLPASSVATSHPTGAYLFTAAAGTHDVSIIDPVRRAEIYRFDAGEPVDRLSVSGDGLRLYARYSADRSVSVFDLSKLVNYGELNVRRMATSTH